jgi:hypothetical protein
MLTDFNSRWGDRCSYVRDVVHGNRNHQIGIPTYAFWATALEPRTKKKLSKVLPEGEELQLWHDIEEAIISLIGYLPNNNAPQQVVEAPAPLAMVNRLLNNNNIFFADSDDEEEDDNVSGPVPIADTIAAEVRNYRAAKGQPM